MVNATTVKLNRQQQFVLFSNCRSVGSSSGTEKREDDNEDDATAADDDEKRRRRIDR